MEIHIKNNIYISSIFIIVVGVLQVIKSQVLEIDDSFVEKKQNHAWLVEFYAPWCGHCRKLEPTFHQVYLELKNSPIIVAKVDATRHTRLASEYEIRGYPSIKFIQNDRVLTHLGERTKEGIIEFAKRAYGPQVRVLSNLGKFNDARSEHTSGVFFVYVGSNGDDDLLWVAFKTLAEKFAVLSYFYMGEEKVLPEDIKPASIPAVLVFKDGTHFVFHAAEDEDLSVSLEKWINRERFSAFPTIGGVGLNEMSSIEKLLVIFVGDDKEKTSAGQKRFREIGTSVAKENRQTLHSKFQFVWLKDAESASNIIMGSIEPPYVFVLDVQAHQHYLPDLSENMTKTDLIECLDGVLQGKYQAYGGTGILQRFKRLFYDIGSTIYSIYHESLVLALMVFGIPTLVIGIICYALCCIEPVDDDNNNMEESDEEGDMEPIDSPEDIENTVEGELEGDSTAQDNDISNKKDR